MSRFSKARWSVDHCSTSGAAAAAAADIAAPALTAVVARPTLTVS